LFLSPASSNVASALIVSSASCSAERHIHVHSSGRNDERLFADDTRVANLGVPLIATEMKVASDLSKL
jgi:hypothetical protein